jgi:hypothetical protein
MRSLPGFVRSTAWDSNGARIIGRLLTAAIISSILTQAAAGQSIRGRVVTTDGRGLEGAAVTALLGGNLVARTFSDSTGSFFVVLRDPGDYLLGVSLLGFRSVDSVRVRVGPKEAVDVTIRMDVSPVRLDPLTINARRADPRHLATYEGFYARRELAKPIGPSRVLVRSDPEMVNAGTINDVLLWLPPARCVAYYINGHLTESFADISVPFLEGIEFYRDHLDAPLDMRGFNSHCGRSGRSPMWSVLALWLRRPGR